MFKISVVTLLLVVSACKANEDDDNVGKHNPNEVVLYNEDEFNEKVGLQSHFVMFYAPWCGHCQRLKPIWDELALNIHKDESVELTIAKVDCTVETKLCSDQGVLGYPTLKLYQVNKEAVRHKGARDLSSLKAFITSTLNSDDTRQPVHKDGLYDLAADNFESHIESSRHFIMFYAPWCGHCKRLEPVWQDLARLYEPTDGNSNGVKIGRVDCTKHRDVCSKYKVQGYPTLLWFEDGTMTAKYQESRQLESFRNFIKKMTNTEDQESDSETAEQASPESVYELIEDSFRDHVATGAHFVMFYAPWCGHCKRLEPVWTDLAMFYQATDKQQDDVKIAKVDCTKSRRLCLDQNVKGYPTLLWFKNGEKIKAYQGSRDITSLKVFIKEQLNPIDIKQEKASEVPVKVDEEKMETDPNGPVTDLNAKNFDFNIALDVTFVKFYAPWCGFCKRLAPVWEELAVQDFSSLNQEVKVARVDCTLNTDLCQNHKVNGYPTLKLYKDGEELAQYSGSRTMEDLKKFVFDTVAAEPIFLDEKDEL